MFAVTLSAMGVLGQLVSLFLVLIARVEAANDTIAWDSARIKYLNVIFLIDWVGQSYFYGSRMGSSSALAIKAIENAQLLPGYSLANWSIVDTHCTHMACADFVRSWESLPSGKLHGVIGPGCSSCMAYSIVASSFNIPQVLSIKHFSSLVACST
jgi:hypothetical protein